ncbi:SMI1/KNR4 family protein [Streptomyces sp. NPDC056402]|uniref:SMI1/KNR4 family protein n=1 Tax=Streptomyces sp. NPDC056402 TaxID=3345810 RepID=UPI0035DD9A1F
MIEPPLNVISPVIPPVATSWQRIDAWLALHAPARLAELAPPASPHTIDQLEVTLGVRLPTDLRASLLCHDGDSSYLGILPCGPLYSTDAIAEVRQMRMEIWEGENDPAEQENPWWGTQWIPFAGSDGDEHFIDAGPGLWHNHLGRASHDEHAYFLGWPSLGSWLHEVAKAMEHHDRADLLHAVAHPSVDEDGEIDW